MADIKDSAVLENEEFINFIWKFLAILATGFGAINLYLIRPLKERLEKLEVQLKNTYDKEDTRREIEMHVSPLASSVENLNSSLERQTKAIQSLERAVNSMERWQQRMIGKGHINGGYDSDNS